MFRVVLLIASALSLSSCGFLADDGIADTGHKAWSKVDESAQKSIGTEDRDLVKPAGAPSDWNF